MKFRDFLSNTLPRRSKRKARAPISVDVVLPPSTDDRCEQGNTLFRSKDASTSTEDCATFNSCCGRQGSWQCDDFSLSDSECRSASECGEANFNTIPRTRSRIRTNPWLPSPKTSPPMSPPTTSNRHVMMTPDSACNMDVSMMSGLSDSSADFLRCSAKGASGRSSDSLSDVDSLLEQSLHSDLSPASFDYERTLESTLEVPGVGRYVGSRDSLNWANRGSGHQEDVFKNMRGHRLLYEGDEMRIDRQERASSEESAASTGTLCNYIPDEGHRCLQEQKSLDSGFYSSHCTSDSRDDVATPSDGRRSVRDIGQSLASKVLRLRQEKRLVDEKIREAREEEKVRQQHIAHFRRQVSGARKLVLLETLEKLRERLSEQGGRLQTCYDEVLNRRWQHAAIIRGTSLP